MHASVLLLNADASPLSLLPLSTISWQTAIKAMFAEKVHVLKNYEDKFLHSSTVTIPVPSIVMLDAYHKIPEKAKFSRKNLYVRDKFTCQYCGNKFAYHELTIDHVLPKSKGGKLIWENSVTACKPCNWRKSDKIIKPLSTPTRPSWHQINSLSKYYDLHIPDEAWQFYLNWPEDKLHIAKNVEVV
jgi:5-methylcytosine-specific restriction endonuclease McrA